MVSLITIHGGAVLLDVDCHLDFTSVPLQFSAEYPDIILGHRVPSEYAVFTHSSRFVQVQVFFEPDTCIRDQDLL